MDHTKKETKPTRAKKQPVDIEKLVEREVEKRMQAKAIAAVPEAHTAEATPIPVVTVADTKPIEQPHEPEIKVIEEKAVGIWGKVKAWKWFWFVVGGVALILVALGYQWVNNIQNKRADAKTEKKKEELKQIIVGGDTTLLMQNEIMAKRILRGDSMVDFVIHAAVDLKKALDYSKSIMPKRLLSIDQETIKTSEKINNPANTDDDVRRNADEQLSKPVIRQR